MKLAFGVRLERALRRLRWAGHAAAEAIEARGRHRAPAATAAERHEEGRR